MKTAAVVGGILALALSVALFYRATEAGEGVSMEADTGRAFVEQGEEQLASVDSTPRANLSEGVEEDVVLPQRDIRATLNGIPRKELQDVYRAVLSPSQWPDGAPLDRLLIRQILVPILDRGFDGRGILESIQGEEWEPYELSALLIAAAWVGEGDPAVGEFLALTASQEGPVDKSAIIALDIFGGREGLEGAADVYIERLGREVVDDKLEVYDSSRLGAILWSVDGLKSPDILEEVIALADRRDVMSVAAWSAIARADSADVQKSVYDAAVNEDGFARRGIEDFRDPLWTPSLAGLITQELDSPYRGYLADSAVKGLLSIGTDRSVSVLVGAVSGGDRAMARHICDSMRGVSQPRAVGALIAQSTALANSPDGYLRDSMLSCIESTLNSAGGFSMSRDAWHSVRSQVRASLSGLRAGSREQELAIGFLADNGGREDYKVLVDIVKGRDDSSRWMTRLENIRQRDW